jgi:hypothetical protein
MKKRLVLTGIVSIILGFGFVMAACDNGSTSDNNDSGGGVPSGLIGKWSTVEDDLAEDSVAFEFTSTGVKIDGTTYTVRFTDQLVEYQSGAGAWTVLVEKYSLSNENKKLVTAGGDYAGTYYKVP